MPGEGFGHAVREFLDEFALRGDDRARLQAIAERPASTTDPRYDERRLTRDIDAVFEPKNVVYEAAAVVAEQRGLPAGWLNDAVKGFLEGSDPAAAPVLDLPGLRCLAASPETPLALKVLAHRVGEDEPDLRLLAAELGLDRADQVLAIAERTYGDRLDPAARFFVEQVFSPR
jgi:hypothetical protein